MSSRESLEEIAERYFTLRRKLGYQLVAERQEVLRFVRAMAALRRRTITLEHVIEWARSSRSGSREYAACKYDRVRLFLAFAASTRSDVVVPPPGYLGRGFGRRSPHIYTATEMAQLLEAALGITPTDGLRPWTYRTLFGLLWATGLRVGEALALDCRDVDLRNGSLTVRRGKSAPRELPLHHSVVQVLHQYEVRRNARHPSPRSTAFFLTEALATRVQYTVMNRAFCDLRRSLHWTTKPLPRVHDLRHTFATLKLLEWMRAGKDVDEEMPALAAYLGHKHPSSTYWYLSAVPELQHLITGYLKLLPRGMAVAGTP
jgi:integrase